MLKLNINGRPHQVDVEADTPLLWVLRDQLQLLGTKYGCGVGECGACTVHVDGEATRSCITPVSAVLGKKVRTIEGLAGKKALHPVQRAWIAHEVPQCGYCQPGMIMAAAALLEKNPKPSAAQIDAAMDNLCRCGTHQRVREAMAALASGEPSGGGRHGS